MQSRGVLTCRREQDGDVAAVRRLVADAFGGGTPVEVTLLDRLRVDEGWISELSLVAGDAADVLGHVVCSRAWIEHQPVVALGPLAVAPAVQRTGVGSALVHAVVAAAEARDEPLVALLGHLDYYPRFGFVPGASLGILPPDPAWGDHFQARPLHGYHPGLRGAFRYAAPFDDL